MNETLASRKNQAFSLELIALYEDRKIGEPFWRMRPVAQLNRRGESIILNAARKQAEAVEKMKQKYNIRQ